MLAAMRCKFDRGGYAKMMLIGVLPDGGEECVTVYWEDNEARPGTVPLYGAFDRLQRMRERFDRGEYVAYFAVAIDHQGRVERVSVGALDRSRWPLARSGGV